MGPETVNKLKDSEIHGDFIGHDQFVTNIIMFEDSEREFVVTHNANIKPVSYFTGRETELHELRQRIEIGRKSVLVSGMGGIGKTHICRKMFEEYLNKHADDEGGPFRHIGYIKYNGDIGSSLQNCLKFKQQEKPEQNQEAAWRELEYLAADGKLLLFVDNVDRPIGEDSGLQRLKGIPGAIVLTSRKASFSDEFEPYPIGFLDMEQCKEIYEKIRFGCSERKVVRPEEFPDLEYIIEHLAGRHTITVELLAHLARTKSWTVKRLREELEQKGFRLVFHKDGELINIQESYEALYNLSSLIDAEQNILEAFSVFPYIPLPAETCNQWLLMDAGVSEDDDVLIGLYRKGWLQFDIGQESYALHPVFAQFIYDKCKPTVEKHFELIKACQKCLRIPEDGFALECQKFIPFAECIVKKVDMEKDVEHVRFIVSIAYLLYYTAQYKQAEELYKKCLCISENVLGDDHLDTATIYVLLAFVYERQGKYQQAEELLRKGLHIGEKVLGEKYPYTAIIYNNLANVNSKRGEYKQAEELYKKALHISEKASVEGYTDTPMICNNLAALYYDQGKCREAEELHKKSLHMNEKVLGEDHPYTARSYHNLANVYFDQGKYDLVLFYVFKAYKVYINKLGFEHPYTKIFYKNMEITYAILNRDGNFKQWLEEKMKE